MNITALNIAKKQFKELKSRTKNSLSIEEFSLLLQTIIFPDNKEQHSPIVTLPKQPQYLSALFPQTIFMTKITQNPNQETHEINKLQILVIIYHHQLSPYCQPDRAIQPPSQELNHTDTTKL